MKLTYIDTHAHLYEDDFLQDQAQVMDRLVQAGVSHVLMPNIDVHTIEPMLRVEARYPTLCKPMIGLHPCYIQADFQQQLYQMEAWLNKHNFIAIGEIGIDLYRDTSYQAQQQEALEIQLSWAKQYKLPVALHVRQAFAETMRLLEKHQDGTLQGVVHCFSGTPAEARQVIELGLCLGIGGIVTFKNGGLASLIAQIGLQHLVLETDCPYLAPVPYRGKRNEPAYLPYIAATIAAIHQISIEQVAAVTTANATRVFIRDVKG
jgi:TatD DNase family protein